MDLLLLSDALCGRDGRMKESLLVHLSSSLSIKDSAGKVVIWISVRHERKRERSGRRKMERERRADDDDVDALLQVVLALLWH